MFQIYFRNIHRFNIFVSMLVYQRIKDWFVIFVNKTWFRNIKVTLFSAQEKVVLKWIGKEKRTQMALSIIFDFYHQYGNHSNAWIFLRAKGFWLYFLLLLLTSNFLHDGAFYRKFSAFTFMSFQGCYNMILKVE